MNLIEISCNYTINKLGITKYFKRTNEYEIYQKLAAIWTLNIEISLLLESSQSFIRYIISKISNYANVAKDLDLLH
ncbi:hypothetical protein HYD54_00840 [Mycoplasmopsis bovis]|nr:hypothetical protein [Mycoplasmopsis bovis]QQH71774.1 hypothetical protein HYD54_00840 [Mycoplasmopsis bovis]